MFKSLLVRERLCVSSKYRCSLIMAGLTQQFSGLSGHTRLSRDVGKLKTDMINKQTIDIIIMFYLFRQCNKMLNYSLSLSLSLSKEHI